MNLTMLNVELFDEKHSNIEDITLMISQFATFVKITT